MIVFKIVYKVRVFRILRMDGKYHLMSTQIQTAISRWQLYYALQYINGFYRTSKHF